VNSVLAPSLTNPAPYRNWPTCLDVIRIGIKEARPTPNQPENWVIDGTPWTLIARPIRSDLQILKNAIVTGPDLLTGCKDRASFRDFEKRQATASLALVAPSAVDFYRNTNSTGKQRVRGRFRLGDANNGQVYDLGVTDLQCERVVLRQGDQTLRQADAKFLLTISLGEPLASYCYKLIAAVIVLPAPIAEVF
jgi:hypothetical protein